MNYRIENGKVYKVEEVNLEELKKEVTQIANYIKQCETTQKPYITAVASKRAELNKLIATKEAEIAQLQLVVDENNRKIEEAKAKLFDRKEIIAQLYPEMSNILGF